MMGEDEAGWLARNRDWLPHGVAVLERLNSQLAGSRSVLALADAHGVLLRVMGEAGELDETLQAKLVPGCCWSEALCGPNALGRVLLRGRPAAVHGGEYYGEQPLNCSSAAAPILRADGRLAGVIAIFGAWHGPQPYLPALMQMAATMVESRLLAVCPAPAPAPMPRKPDAGPATLAELLGGDAAVDAAARRALRIVDKDIPLLIEGDTGTGKEVFARAFHHSSPRAGRPFVALNCAAIPEGLIESELFGYEEGAFTGARRRGSPGKIAQAHGGTLFLDEIGDMPLNLQARLLRVLQEREVTPLGSQRVLPIDIALVCATNRRLQQAVEQGRFREDLFYRINGLRVSLPALKDRSDLAQLVEALLAGEGAPGRVQVSQRALERFRRHPWPGNLRQLRSVLRTALAHLDGDPVLDLVHLPDDFLAEPPLGAALESDPAPPPNHSLDEPAWLAASGSLAEMECAAMRRALEECAGNVSAAARRLGVSRNTLYRRLGLNGR
jgi:transcriptional regulator of acetoin/glycerol metabolism